jgi:MFS family permease
MDYRACDQLCVSVRYMRINYSQSFTSLEPDHLIYQYRKASFTEDGIAKEFNVSKQLTVLGLSLFVLGLGLGPLLIGPLSEVYGRNPIYQVSYLLFFVFSWPVVFAPDIGMQTLVLIVNIELTQHTLQRCSLYFDSLLGFVDLHFFLWQVEA